jgi:hypothetical protein
MPRAPEPTTAQPQHDQHITLDLTQAREARLAHAASRTATLLKSATSPELIAVLVDFLGVIYSLVFANRGGFTDRTNKPIEVSVLKTRAQQLATGHVRMTGTWMAGYHFNSALIRTSAVYHRALKTINNQNATLKTLVPLTKAAYTKTTGKNWEDTNLELVRGQVNNLKHDADGTYHTRQVTYEQAVTAAEELLTVIEVLG